MPDEMIKDKVAAFRDDIEKHLAKGAPANDATHLLLKAVHFMLGEPNTDDEPRVPLDETERKLT